MQNNNSSNCCFRMSRIDSSRITQSSMNLPGLSHPIQTTSIKDLNEMNLRDQWSMLMANRTSQMLDQKGGNLHLIQMDYNLFTIIPVLEPEEVNRKVLNRRTMFNTRKTVYRHTTKHRHRKNFDQNVKKRILDLYWKMITEDPSYSIRNVALAIYNIMSKEA